MLAKLSAKTFKKFISGKINDGRFWRYMDIIWCHTYSYTYPVSHAFEKVIKVVALICPLLDKWR